MANKLDITFRIKGLDKAEAEIQRLAKKYPEAARRALYRNAEFIMTDSKQNYVPVDEGQLRASGHVVMDATKLEVTLGFGGPAGIGNVSDSNDETVGYAIVQHEVDSYEHTVGEDKYLEKPLMAALPRLAGDIGRDIKEEVGG